MRNFAHTRRQLIAASGLVLVVLFAVAVTMIFNQNGPVPPQVVAPKTAMVIVNEDGFAPQSLIIKTGMAVIWQNQNNAPQHISTISAIADNKNSSLSDFNSGTTLGPNSTYTYTFNQPGTYHYINTLDPTQYNGTIIVK